MKMKKHYKFNNIKIYYCKFIMFSKRIIRYSPKFKIIKNIEYPACHRCFNFRNFIPIEGDSHFEYSKIGVCMKFGEKDMVTCKIKYDYAINCRNDISKCSRYARYFTPLKPPFFLED